MQNGFCQDEAGNVHNECNLATCMDGCIRERIPNPAIIEDPLEDPRNKISALAIVDPNVEMGHGNVIMEGAIIRAGVVLGNNNYVGPYCIIGDVPEKIGYFDKPAGVRIGNGNRFTKQVTIDSGTDKPTVVWDNVIMLKNAHVGHDAEIMSKVILSCNVCVGGHTYVGTKCNFGLGAAVHQRVKVPEGIMLGMNSTITKTTMLEPFTKYVGSPARKLSINKKALEEK